MRETPFSLSKRILTRTIARIPIAINNQGRYSEIIPLFLMIKKTKVI